MADQVPSAGFVVLVTSEVRTQARLLDEGRIFPTVQEAAKAIALQHAMFGSFYRLQLVELVPVAAGQPVAARVSS